MIPSMKFVIRNQRPFALAVWRLCALILCVGTLSLSVTAYSTTRRMSPRPSLVVMMASSHRRSSLSSSTTTSTTSSTKASSTTTDASFQAFADSMETEEFQPDNDEPWQVRLEALLDPATTPAQRQILLSELLSANQEIRDSVSEALRDRKLDPLLTPTGKKLQDGTFAVARQLTSDILPSLAAAASRGAPPPPDFSKAVPKIGSRILNALSNQAKRTLAEFQQDLQNPSRIPQRLSQQTEDLAKEAKNVFLETPEGFQGPSYTVLRQGTGYEIREYPGYTVASTTMGKVGEPYSMDDVASGGAAFNALAAYLFGANQEGASLQMTTPVTTTNLGEMRFYLSEREASFPAPLQDDSLYEAGAVQIVDIPPARLAVRRFTGFVTEGEVARQKDVLLNQLALDGVELDVPHGAVVPHAIFQYNPPYTIPMVRRNEIALPVATEQGEAADLKTEWGRGDDDMNFNDVETPSDVE